MLIQAVRIPKPKHRLLHSETAQEVGDKFTSVHVYARVCGSYNETCGKRSHTVQTLESKVPLGILDREESSGFRVREKHSK